MKYSLSMEKKLFPTSRKSNHLNRLIICIALLSSPYSSVVLREKHFLPPLMAYLKLEFVQSITDKHYYKL